MKPQKKICINYSYYYFFSSECSLLIANDLPYFPKIYSFLSQTLSKLSLISICLLRNASFFFFKKKDEDRHEIDTPNNQNHQL